MHVAKLHAISLTKASLMTHVDLDVLLLQSELVALSRSDLLLDQIYSSDHLCDRVFDLHKIQPCCGWSRVR